MQDARLYITMFLLLAVALCALGVVASMDSGRETCLKTHTEEVCNNTLNG